MEENYQKIKPSGWFTIQLFLFMVVIFLLTIGQFNSFASYWNDAINPIETKVLVFSGIIDALAYTYAFLSIYKALQNKPYSISMLRLSVFYILVQLIFKMQDKIGSVIPSHPYFFIPLVLFLIIFFVYLFKSKHLNAYIPKTKRKFGIWGWVGVLIYLMVFAMYAYMSGKELYKRYNSLPLELSSVILNEGESTDGLTAFKPLAIWQNDTVMGNAKDGYMHVYHTEDCPNILVTAMNAECKTRIDYYMLLNDLCSNLLPDSVRLKEEEYKDSVINGNKYYLNTYSFVKEGDTVYWTFSALMPTDYYKVMTLSSITHDSYRHSIEMSDEFMKKVRFKLEKR